MKISLGAATGGTSPKVGEWAFTYLASALLVVSSGAVYFSKIHYSATIVALFAVALAGFFPFRVSRGSLVVLVGTLAVVWTNLLVFQQNPSGYVGLTLKLLAAYMLVQRLRRRLFATAYVNIITVLAAVSLPFYFFGVLFPDIVRLSIPLSSGWGGDYRVTPLYVYGAYSMGRNQGIFWEPGAYQVFLNIGLLILLMASGLRWRRTKIAILVLTIGTTYSTTGYLVALLCFVAASAASANRDALKIAVRVLILGAIGAMVLSSSVVVDKISGTNSSYLRRSVDTSSAFQLAVEHPWLGWGYQNNLILFERFYIQDTSNSILALAYQFGIPAAVAFLGLVILGIRSLIPSVMASAIVFVAYLVVVSTENMILQPLFLCLLFVGLSREAKSVATAPRGSSINARLDRRV